MNTQSPWKFTLLLVLAMITWGFAWPSGKSVAGLAHPHIIIFWRFLFTALSLIPVVLFLGKSFRLPGKMVWIQVGIGGILYTVYNQFFLLGLENGLPGAGGVLVTTLNPIFTYLLVHIFTRALPEKDKIFGLLMGILAGLIMLRIWDISWDSLLQTGNLFFLFGSISWAFLSMNSHSTGEKISPVVYSFYVYSIGTLFDLLLAWNQPLLSVFDLDWKFWFHVFYLAIVSTTFGTTVYFFAATRLGSRLASSFIFLVPVSAMLGSWIFYKEIPEWNTVFGGLIAIIAVTLLNRNSKESKRIELQKI